MRVSCSPHIAVGKSCLFASQTHAHTHTVKTGTSVMRSEESKLKEPQHCTLSGVKRERKREEEKAVRWVGMGKNEEGEMEGWRRCPQTAWELLTPSLQD